MKYLILLIASIIALQMKAQILNVDRENGQDSIPRKQLFSWNVSFSSDKQKKNLLELTNIAEYDRFLKKDRLLVMLLNTDASFNGKAILENNGYFQMRLRDNDKKEWLQIIICNTNGMAFGGCRIGRSPVVMRVLNSGTTKPMTFL